MKKFFKGTATGTFKTAESILGIVPALFDVIFLILVEVARITKKYGKVEQLALVLIFKKISNGITERSKWYGLIGLAFWVSVLIIKIYL